MRENQREFHDLIIPSTPILKILDYITFGIGFLCEFQRLRCRYVSVCGRHCQDDTVRVADVLHAHVSDQLLDVLRLVPDRDLRDAGEVDQGQGQHVRRVDTQVDGFAADTLRRKDATRKSRLNSALKPTYL